MSLQLLTAMAQSGDPLTRQNANVALSAQGRGSDGQPLNAAPTPAPAPAPAPAPRPAPPMNQPAPPPAAPASPAPAQGDAGLEAARDANGLIFGKYRTAEEARRGYFNAVNTLSVSTDELVRLRNQPTGANLQPTMLPGSAPGDAPRVNPAAQSFDIQKAVDDLVKSSEESGQIDPKVLLQTVTSIATQAAAAATDARLLPMQAMAEADSYMRAKYPLSVNHAQELGNFVKTDPTVGPTVQSLLGAGQFKAAFEYAWNMYTVANGIVTERAVETNAQIAEEERAKARAAAGFSGSPNTGIHAEAQKQNELLTPDEKQQLNQIAGHSREGEAVRRRAYLGAWLPPEWRTWENQ